MWCYFVACSVKQQNEQQILHQFCLIMAVKKVKEPIRLRQRKIAGGNISLYLDIYVDGVRSYEYLKLYLIPEKTKEDKQTNQHTLALANAIKSQRIVELQNDAHGFANKSRSDVKLLDFLYSLVRLDVKRQSRFGGLAMHVENFEKNKNITFRQITRDWGVRFFDYLCHTAVNLKCGEKNLSKNTCLMYYKKFSQVMNMAVKDKIISSNPFVDIKLPQPDESTRMYLTIEEVQKLSQTFMYNDEIKRMFLFSCLTGLRSCDIFQLTSNEIVKQGEFTRIIFRQQKTHGLEYLDITPQAVELLGDYPKDGTPIFHHWRQTHMNRMIAKWVERAGIKKHITFHCARHTFATMMLDLGVDIYTVSKLLGHTEVATTQIYTKVLDKNKQKAVANIPDVLHHKE